MLAAHRAGTASATVLPAVVLTLGFLVTAVPDRLRQAGLDVWNIGRYHDQLRTGADEAARLEDERAAAHTCCEMLGFLTRRLIAGDSSLEEATASAEPLLLELPGFSDGARRSFPAPSIRLSVALCLIDHVRNAEGIDQSRQAAALECLECEYRDMLQRD